MMLASIPIPSSSNMMNPNRRYLTSQRDWPLNELEENMMTLATCSQINNQKKAAAIAQLTNTTPSYKINRSSVLRCSSCQRKFHSQGNLSNHQQLYQH